MHTLVGPRRAWGEGARTRPEGESQKPWLGSAEVAVGSLTWDRVRL